ncbi:LOW QUALITY PROTEIN: hypothetical protein HID58_052365, partial [Brassica napus]
PASQGVPLRWISSALARPLLPPSSEAALLSLHGLDGDCSSIVPPPHPPSLPCKPLPLEACSLIIFPEPPDPTAALIRLLAPLHILEPSVSSSVHVVAVTPLSFFATTKGLTRSVFVSFGVRVSTTCRFQSSPTFQIEPWFLFEPLFVQKVFSVSSCNKPYMDEYYLVLGISCVKMNHLAQNEDVALSLNLLLPLKLMLLKMEVLDGSSSCRIVCWTLKALNSNVFFPALHSGMSLNGIAGCLLDITNLATPFTLLSFKFYQYKNPSK